MRLGVVACVSACGVLWHLCLVRLTRIVKEITVVLSKVNFDNFCTEPAARPNRRSIKPNRAYRSSRVLLGTQERHAGGWVATDDGE